MIKNMPYIIRNKIGFDGLLGLKNNFFYRVKYELARVNGLLWTLRGLVKYENESRSFIVGLKTDILLSRNGRIVLCGKKNQVDHSRKSVPFAPYSSCIGFVPHWKFLDPPPNRTTKLRLQENARLVLMPNSLICSGAYISIWPNQELRIGNNVYIGHNSYINTRCSLIIGDNALISHDVTIMDYDGHPIKVKNSTNDENTYGGKSDKIEIGRDVWIGFGVTILKGVKIGSGSIVGAGSFVVDDVPENTIVAGHPAKILKDNITWAK